MEFIIQVVANPMNLLFAVLGGFLAIPIIDFPKFHKTLLLIGFVLGVIGILLYGILILMISLVAPTTLLLELKLTTYLIFFTFGSSLTYRP